MGNITQNTLLATLLYIVTILITTNKNGYNAQTLPHVSSHLTTQPPSHSPSHAPSHVHAPSPSHHHHHPHHHHHSPALAPSPSYVSTPPKRQPSKPVTPSPPPAHHHGVKRQLVAVQGMVYCKSNCNATPPNVDVVTLLGASPLPGARVVLRCRNTQYLLRQTATTDKNGYFFMEAPPAVTTYGAHKCKVYLAQKPNGPSSCSNATDLNNGLSGSYLFSNNTGPPNNALPNFSLFSVGPFAYVSATCHKD